MLTKDRADRILAALEAGKTFREITRANDGGRCTPFQYKSYAAANPEWGAKAEALALQNRQQAYSRRVQWKRNKTHCSKGHALEDAYVCMDKKTGRLHRQCRQCKLDKQKVENARAPKSEEITRVKEALLSGINVRHIINGVPMGSRGKRRPGARIISAPLFYRMRQEDPGLEILVQSVIVSTRRIVAKHAIATRRFNFERRSVNDYHVIRAMIPAYLPDRDDILSRIFEDMLSGTLQRADVPKRVKGYVTEHNRMFPTKFRRFGNAKLVSLDELVFEDGSTTIGDQVSEGLWA